MKKFVLLLIVLLGTVGASAINVPKLKAIPEYEIKSEVINFDYSKMAYPYSDVKIGGEFSVKDTIVVPKKLEPGKPIDYSGIKLNSLLDGFFIIFGVFILCIFITLILLIIDAFWVKPYRH